MAPRPSLPPNAGPQALIGRRRTSTDRRPGYSRLKFDRVRFEELVAEAVDSLPQWVLDRLENVEVLVEDRPPRGEPNLLGQYRGIPLTNRMNYAGVLPDTITLFRSTIERS